MGSATIKLGGLVSPSGMQEIDRVIKSFEGVYKESVSVLFKLNKPGKVKLNFDTARLSIQEIVNAITALGYQILKLKVKII
ncbi:MAG TPA: heavy-metal-associated domain-containing protein [Firmicutes bacterium]|jgi:copper chaperone|nr:heavy-metal-associated domain-containing protein [Bacillota bacterium]